MILTGQQKKILKEGILGAYPNEDELKILLSERMNSSYSAIATGDNYTSRVAFLVEKLGADGEVEKLIKVIIEDKPNSPHLTQVKTEPGFLRFIDMGIIERLNTLLIDGGYDNFQISFNSACNILKYRHNFTPTICEKIPNLIYNGENKIRKFTEKLHGITSRFECAGQKPTLLYVFVKDFLEKINSNCDGQYVQDEKLFSQCKKLFMKEVNTWLDEYVSNQHITLEPLYFSDRPRLCLLIKVSEERKEKTKTLEIKHWITQDTRESKNCLIPSSARPDSIPFRGSLNGESLSRLRQSIHDIIQQELENYKTSLRGVFGQTDLENIIFDSIEIFVPHAFIAEIDSPDFNLFAMMNMNRICERIILRFSERLKLIDDDVTKNWKKRHDIYKKRIKSLTLNQIPTFYSTAFYRVDASTDGAKRLHSVLQRKQDIVAVAICMLDVNNKTKFKSVMRTLLANGIPLAFWIRGSQYTKDVFQNIFIVEPEKLLENIFRCKRECHPEVYNDLSLIWDDYDRVPPEYLLKMPRS